MAKGKGNLASPFTNQLIPDHGEAPPKGAVTDHNVCPYFSKPREHKDGLAEVFFSEVNGDTHHGPITGKSAITSTMGSTKKD